MGSAKREFKSLWTQASAPTRTPEEVEKLLSHWHTQVQIMRTSRGFDDAPTLRR